MKKEIPTPVIVVVVLVLVGIVGAVAFSQFGAASGPKIDAKTVPPTRLEDPDRPRG